MVSHPHSHPDRWIREEGKEKEERAKKEEKEKKEEKGRRRKKRRRVKRLVGGSTSFPS